MMSLSWSTVPTLSLPVALSYLSSGVFFGSDSGLFELGSSLLLTKPVDFEADEDYLIFDYFTGETIGLWNGLSYPIAGVEIAPEFLLLPSQIYFYNILRVSDLMAGLTFSDTFYSTYSSTYYWASAFLLFLPLPFLAGDLAGSSPARLLVITGMSNLG